MRISKVWALGLVLAGCGEVALPDLSDLPGLSLARAASEAPTEPVKEVLLARDTIMVRGPEAYCIDMEASRTRTNFVVLAGCHRVAAIPEAPLNDGILTVQIGRADTAIVTDNESELASLLQDDGGADLLGEGATVLSTRAAAGAVLVETAPLPEPPFDGVSGPRWRAFMDQKGRLITVALYMFEDELMGREAGQALLADAVAAIRAANVSE